MSSRHSNAFTNGVIVGFLGLSSLLLIVGLLTNSAYFILEDTEDNADIRETFKSPHRNEVSKKSLLTVVISSISHRRTVSLRVRSTWGSSAGKNDYVIVTGSGSNKTEVPVNVVELRHEDFPSFIHLNHEELAFVLSQIRELYLDTYRWFLLVPANTYVSSAHMDSMLMGLDPYEVVYLGHPASNRLSNGQHYCRAGPGILLSYGALLMIGKDIERCIKGETHLNPDAALGECMVRHLYTECYKSKVNQVKLFVYDVAGLSKEPSNLWQEASFQGMATLHPVRDPHQLEAVHAWNQVREISQHKVKARKSLKKMKESYLCVNSIPECGLRLNGKILSEISYKDLRSKCLLFTRGHEAELLHQLDVWDVTIGEDIYSPRSVEPRRPLEVWMTEELDYATSVAMEMIRLRSPDLELYNVGNCYMRHKGLVGQEFIFDLELKHGGKQAQNGVFKKRVAFRLPFKSKFQFLHNTGVIHNLTATTINLLVPLSASDNVSKIPEFIKYYHRLCIKQGGNCRIIFILLKNSGEENIELKKKVKFLRKKHPFLIRNASDLGKEYVKTRKYDPGMSVLSDNELAILADLDISMDTKFLDRCRQYAVRGSQIYYPYVFRYYNMKYAYKDRWHPKKPSFVRKHGHWTKHSTICLYKSDYMTVGKYEEIRKWELQPDLVPTLKGGLEVLQSPDPGLTQGYVEPKCDINLPSAELTKCLSDSKNDLGDRAVLANYALSLEETCKRQKELHNSKFV